MIKENNSSMTKENYADFQQELDNAFKIAGKEFQKTKNNIKTFHSIALIGLACIPLCLTDNEPKKNICLALAFTGLITANEIKKKERHAFLTNNAFLLTLSETKNQIISDKAKNTINQTMFNTFQTNKTVTLANIIASGTLLGAYLTGNILFETGALTFSLIDCLTEGYSFRLNKNANRVIRASLPTKIVIPDITKRVKE